MKTDPLVPEERHFILSSASPTASQKGLALAVVIGILTVFALVTVGPLKGVQVDPVNAFVPSYVMAMFVCDTVTAILLYAQFSIVRSRAILVIASGYLFAALIMIPYVMVFPGLFTPGKGLMGGMQTTSWIYFFQHAGFPLFIIGYALLKEGQSDQRFWRGTVPAKIALNIVSSIAFTAALVAVAAFLFIYGEALLPRVTVDSRHLGPAWPYAGTPVGLLNVAAIVILWNRRRSLLDLWLMVVMFVYAIEIPLSYYPDPQRFSVGWYSVRVMGVFASSIVLILLIHEIATLYARLLNAVLAQRRERAARLMTGDAVAASIAHEVRQPLTAMVTTADAGLRFLDRTAPNLDKAMEAFRRIAADGHRAGAVVANIRGNFKSDAQEKTSFDLGELVQEALAVARADLQAHRINVQVESNEKLPKARGNRVQLQQVLLNLIMNAIDAMAAKEGPRALTIKSEAYEGDHVMVSIADTGSGIDSRDLERIFNPLFTTKANGMGMGLSICRALVEAHEGRLWFAPNNPAGAVFHFTLHADA